VTFDELIMNLFQLLLLFPLLPLLDKEEDERKGSSNHGRSFNAVLPSDATPDGFMMDPVALGNVVD
jgi:hypothetical protein